MASSAGFEASHCLTSLAYSPLASIDDCRIDKGATHWLVLISHHHRAERCVRGWPLYMWEKGRDHIAIALCVVGYALACWHGQSLGVAAKASRPAYRFLLRGGLQPSATSRHTG